MAYFVMSSRFVHGVSCVPASVLSVADKYSGVHIDHIPLVHSSVAGHAGCFHLLAVVPNAPTQVGVQISVLVPAFKFFGYEKSMLCCDQLFSLMY